MIGPHVILDTEPALRFSSQARIVKGVNVVHPLRVAPDGAIRVYRRYFPDQDLLRLTPTIATRQILEGLNGYRHRNLYVELLNETYQYRGQGLEEYTKWTREAVGILHGHGLKVAGFGFSTGCPEYGDWLYLKAQGYAGVDAISMHEYWGNSGLTGWNALRYRKVHEWTGKQHPPFIMTEIGRDRVEGGKGGWKLDGVSAAQYLNELAVYNTEIEKDSYVIGGVIFTAGPTPDWENFSTDGITDELIKRFGRPADSVDIGSGFKKAESLVGRYLESETYHRAGQPQEVSFAWGENGLSIYIKEFNEVVTVRRDGQLWADNGNRGDGKMKRLR